MMKMTNDNMTKLCLNKYVCLFFYYIFGLSKMRLFFVSFISFQFIKQQRKEFLFDVKCATSFSDFFPLKIMKISEENLFGFNQNVSLT